MIWRDLKTQYINQRNFALVSAGAALLAIAAFFIYEFKFLRAPALEITAPASPAVIVESDSLEVGGRTDPDADLTLNGRPLYSGGTGEFSEKIYLFKGVNKLEFEVRNRYGKTTKITRYVVVK